MCGRFSLFTPAGDLAERFDATPTRAFEPRYNVAPGDDVAVIRNDAPAVIDELEWGLIPHWVEDPDDWSKPINARGETVAEKPSFRDAFDRRRCLVLADGFYEWQERPRGPKQPYRVVLGEDDPFAMAGLWEEWSSNDDVRRTVTIVTTDANDLMAPIHDRMPVVLAPDEEDRWLAADDPGELQGLLDPYDGEDMHAHPVSTAVNDPSNDRPGVVEPVDDPQSGLGDFA
ncbi:SOS response-associated peptidase [Halobacteriaceae archaeon GCM10025711]